MTILRNLLESRSVEDPRYPLTSSRITDWFGNRHQTNAGVSVTTSGAISKTIAVYRAIALVSGAIAALPLEAFRAGPSRERYYSPFIREPHWDMTQMELWETALFHLLGWGDFYAEKIRDGSTAVRYIDPIPPSAVTPRRDGRTKRFEVSYDNGTTRDFGTDDILHVPGPGYDGVHGLSPIGVARQGIGLSLAAEEYGARLFGSGSLQQGFLSTDGVIADEAEADRIKARWKAKMTGIGHAHEVGVLSGGLKFQSLSIPPQDAQFIESRQFQVIEIARLYGIPPHLLGEVTTSTSWGTGIEQQAIGFIVYTLKPWLSRLEQRLSKECLTRPIVCQFNTADLQRGDEAGRAASARVWIESGVKSRQEVRLTENLPPVTGADHFVIPANWMVLGPDGHPATTNAEPHDHPAAGAPPQPETTPLLAETVPMTPLLSGANGASPESETR